MGVIVDYGNGRMRIIESVLERVARERANTEVRLIRQVAQAPTAGLVDMLPVRAEWWQKGPATDTKCWKNQRHASRNWLRHLTRVE